MKINEIKDEIEYTGKAIDFFQKSGVVFPDKTTKNNRSLSIYINDNLKRPVILTPFSFMMSRQMVLGLYLKLIKNGSERKVKIFISILNQIIREHYAKGSLISHNVETGKYMMKPSEVISVFSRILSEALEYHGYGDLKNIGDLYDIFGGRDGLRSFMTEVFLVTEASIPSFEHEAIHVQKVTPIRCRTCKNCICYADGDMICKKGSYKVSPEEYQSNKDRYWDCHHSNETDSLVSMVIDERITECELYKAR